MAAYNLFLKEVTKDAFTDTGGTALAILGRETLQPTSPSVALECVTAVAGAKDIVKFTLPGALVTELNEGAKVIKFVLWVNVKASGTVVRWKLGLVSPALEQSSPTTEGTTQFWFKLELTKAQAEELTKAKLEALEATLEHLTTTSSKAYEIYAELETEAAATSFSGTVTQSLAFRQTLIGSKAATGSVKQPFAYRQSETGLKAALGTVKQAFALRQSTTGLKGALGTVKQSLAFRQATAAFKSASGPVTQSMAFRQATVGVKSVTGAVKQAFAFAQQLSSAEVFSGAISQALAFRQTVSGYKSASGTVTQREAFAQRVTGFKATAGAVVQAFAARGVVAGLKSAAGSVRQAFGFVQRLATGGEPRPEVQVYATVVGGKPVPLSVNPGSPMTMQVNRRVTKGLYPKKGLFPKKGLYPSAHTRTVFMTVTPEGVDD